MTHEGGYLFLAFAAPVLSAMLSIVQVIISSSERLVFNPYFLSIFSPAACSFFEGAEVLSQGAEVLSFSTFELKTEESRNAG